VRNVWNNVAVGEADDFRLSLDCNQDEPSRWVIVIDTPLLHLWLETPNHNVAHDALLFFERTRGTKPPLRLDIAVGTFCGHRVRLTKNDEDERYFLQLLPSEGSNPGGDFFMRIEDDVVEQAVSALRQVVKQLDARPEPH